MNRVTMQSTVQVGMVLAFGKLWISPPVLPATSVPGEHHVSDNDGRVRCQEGGPGSFDWRGHAAGGIGCRAVRRRTFRWMDCCTAANRSTRPPRELPDVHQQLNPSLPRHRVTSVSLQNWPPDPEYPELPAYSLVAILSSEYPGT